MKIKFQTFDGACRIVSEIVIFSDNPKEYGFSSVEAILKNSFAKFLDEDEKMTNRIALSEREAEYICAMNDRYRTYLTNLISNKNLFPEESRDEIILEVIKAFHKKESILLMKYA